MTTGTIQALVGCQVDACAAEISYPLDMVRMLNGKPVCQECYEELSEDDDYPISWNELPPVTMGDLRP